MDANKQKHIELRADILFLIERYFALLDSKYKLFLSSNKILSSAVHSIKMNNFESAEDILITHSDLIENINLVDYDSAAVIQQLSRISGIDDTSMVIPKIIAKDKTMNKRKNNILKSINECVVLSDSKLSFIKDAFENKIRKNNAELKSLEIVDKLREKLILPKK